MASKENITQHEVLNKIHKDKSCVYCGRKYPDVILNIEGFIHHSSKVHCFDLKNCNRFRKKNK